MSVYLLLSLFLGFRIVGQFYLHLRSVLGQIIGTLLYFKNVNV